jgi:hypothetical protein
MDSQHAFLSHSNDGCRMENGNLFVKETKNGRVLHCQKTDCHYFGKGLKTDHHLHHHNSNSGYH